MNQDNSNKHKPIQEKERVSQVNRRRRRKGKGGARTITTLEAEEGYLSQLLKISKDGSRGKDQLHTPTSFTYLWSDNNENDKLHITSY